MNKQPANVVVAETLNIPNTMHNAPATATPSKRLPMLDDLSDNEQENPSTIAVPSPGRESSYGGEVNCFLYATKSELQFFTHC